MKNSSNNGSYPETGLSAMLERVRYFPRQMITAEDLTQEQRYFREKLRRHNRLLHGWGVVCGALVCPKFKSDGTLEPWKVIVKPGYILGPYGDEIIIDQEREVDLRTSGVAGVTGEPAAGSDPWCSDVFIKREPGGPLYVAVKYREIMSRPVRVHPAGCGCDESVCEYSRWLDGYEIGILTQEQYREYQKYMGTSSDWPDLFPSTETSPEECSLPDCCPCPQMPWVVLACINMDANGMIQSINNRDPRRLVFAFGCHHWQCQKTVKISSVSIPELDGVTFNCAQNANPIVVPQQVLITLTISGEGFQKEAKVYLGAGIEIKEYDYNELVSNKRFDAKIKVNENAEPSLRDVVVVNPDCFTAICPGALQVAEYSGTTAETTVAKPAAKKQAPGRKKASKKRKK